MVKSVCPDKKAFIFLSDQVPYPFIRKTVSVYITPVYLWDQILFPEQELHKAPIPAAVSDHNRDIPVENLS